MPQSTPARPAGPTDALALLAILIGARRAGDRLLEVAARRTLENEHQIKVRFLMPSGQEAAPCA
jgi:hypothetical protein